jgi:hypothetical protein
VRWLAGDADEAGGGKRVERYIEDAMASGRPSDDVWKLDKINNSSKEAVGYPTQKPEALLERVVGAFSDRGDVVLDCFVGSGTTAAWQSSSSGAPARKVSAAETRHGHALAAARRRRQGICERCRFSVQEQMVHTYRNHQRNKRLAGDIVGGVVWLFGGLLLVGFVSVGVAGHSLLGLVLSAPILLLLLALWMWPAYLDFFRRYYEIRLSDEGDCEFRAALGSKYLRARQIISVQRDCNSWRWDTDDDEHTRLRFGGGGSLVVVQPVDGFDDFLSRLQALNPAIDLKPRRTASVARSSRR